MDNAQRFSIDLDSPLEVSSEHDLVPATQPTLAFNQQSLVSGLLMNTIKYERDGVFCGKYLYDYDVKYTYKIESPSKDLEISHPDPDNPAYDPMLIHPDDVARNFYWYEEAKRYAIDVRYPNTNRIFNVGFVCGFLKDNILSGAIGNNLKVDRTNADGLNEAGVISGQNLYTWDDVNSNGVVDNGETVSASDGPDQYVITGKTNRENKDFRLTADVYSRQLNNHIESDTGVLDKWKDFIPTQYDASLTFGPDKINCQVVHETMDQDNVAIAMPAMLLNETGKDLFVSNVEKSGNAGVTRLDFDRPGANNYVSIPNSNPNIILGSGLGLQRVEQTRFNAGGVDAFGNPTSPIDEYDEIFVQNTDDIYLNPDSPNLNFIGMADLELQCGEAVVAVDSTTTTHIKASVTDSLSSYSVEAGGMQVLTKVAAKVIHNQINNGVRASRVGRPTTLPYNSQGVTVDSTPIWWNAGQKTTDGGPEITIQLDASFTSYVYREPDPVGTEQCNNIVRGNWEDCCGCDCGGVVEDCNEWARDYAAENGWDTYKATGMASNNCDGFMKDDSCDCCYKFTISGGYTESESLKGSGTLIVVIRCVDIEGGDWRVVRTTGSGASEMQFNVGDQVVMDDDLAGGFIKVAVSIDVGVAALNAAQTKKSSDSGIVFRFMPHKVKYIKDVRFRQSKRNTLTLLQGDQAITAKVSVQPWDFVETLTYADGVTLPVGAVTIPQIPPYPDFDIPDIDPGPAPNFEYPGPIPPIDQSLLPPRPDITDLLPTPPPVPPSSIPVYTGWTHTTPPDPPLSWPGWADIPPPNPGVIVPPDPLPDTILPPTGSDLPFDWDDWDQADKDVWVLQWMQNRWIETEGIIIWQNEQRAVRIQEWKDQWMVDWNVSHTIIPNTQLPTGFNSWDDDVKFDWWYLTYVPAFIAQKNNEYWNQTTRTDPVLKAILEAHSNEVQRIINEYRNTILANYNATKQAEWREQRIAELTASALAVLQQQWLNEWLMKNSSAGAQHNQCIWLEYRGLSKTEIRRVRYVVKLPQVRMAATIGTSFINTSAKYDPLIWSYTELGVAPIESYGSVKTTGRLFDMAGTLGSVCIKEPQLGDGTTNPTWGVWRLINLKDNTRRRLWFRRGFIVSTGGEMWNTTISSLSGPPDSMSVVLSTPKSPTNWLSVFTYDNGSFTFNAAASNPAKYELSYDNDYQRILQFSDQQWAIPGGTVKEFMTQIESILVSLRNSNAQSTDNDEITTALTTLIWMVYDGINIERINRFIDSGILAGTSVSNLLVGYTGVVKVVSQFPDVYRLVFRDADKANFDFFPKGIYIRSNENIRYLSYNINTVYLPAVGTSYSYTTTFDYSQRDMTQVKNAKVTVHELDFYNAEGRGYTSVEIHDPQTGQMQAVQLANPDLDFAFITRQFDTDLYTDNMFYIDREHILKVTSRQLVLLELQDDKWVERRTTPRSSVFTDDTEAMRYGVTSAIEAAPMMWMIRSAVSAIEITLFPLIPPGPDYWNDNQYFDYFDRVVLGMKKTVSIPMSDAHIMGFSSSRLGFISTPPVSAYFVNTISITSTRVGNYCLIGMVYDKGINQWTACVHASTSSRSFFVFNGYGCVGVDGTVTGSAVPMFAMNARSGLSVIIRDKPDVETGFKVNRTAFVSGESLVFCDEKFNRGICVGTKFLGSRFSLKSIPLRFSRFNISKSSSATGVDTYAGMQMIAFPNFGFKYSVSTWAWATAYAGLAMNSWVTQHLLDEADILQKVELEEQVDGSPPNDVWFKFALAILMTVAERAGQGASNSLQQTLDNKYKRIYGASTAVTNEADLAKGAGKSTDADSESIAKQIGASTDPNKWTDEQAAQISREMALQQTANTLADNNKFFNTMINLERKTRPPGQLATQALDEVRDRLTAAMATQSGGNVSAVAIAVAQIGSSNLYSVGPNQNVWAGPGFTQIHFSQGSRISGSCSNCRAAVDNGALFVPRIPPIPLPYIGPLDINHDGAVGIHPITDYAPIFDPTIELQPNFNVGSKHIVYSYPIKDIQDHTINQTQLAPAIARENTVLYESEHKTRNFNKQILTFEQWDETEEITDNCSLVQGVDSYNSGEETMKIPILTDSGYANFATPGHFDYCVYPPAEMYYNAVAGQVIGVSIRDTLVLDGAPSNVLIKGNLPLIASAYTCVEVVRNLTKDTIRPQLLSGDTLLFPITGKNVVKGLQVLHGCDGYTNRIAKLVGVTAVDGEVNNTVYSHARQGVVKAGNIVPGTTYMGKFDMVPQLDSYLHPVDVYATYLNNIGMSRENLQGYRYSIPVVHRSLGLLPAAVQTLAPYKLNVIDGVTSLTTDIRTTESRNKAPEAHDFVIYGNPFRVNGEYISKLNSAQGTVALEDAVATLGLRYVGSTPQQAWFYTNITNGFYTFTMSNPTIGATSMESAGNAFRFKDVETGTWDFVAQEIAFKTLMDRDINDRHDYYKDIVRVKDQFLGTIPPPNTYTVAKNGYFDLDSTAQGVAMRGVHRSQVAMHVWHDYMFREQITSGVYAGLDGKPGIPGYDRFTGRVNDGLIVNHGLWDKVKGDKLIDFFSHRRYDWNRYDKIYGYYVDEYKLGTSFIGLENHMDCMFEWEITFALTPMMRRLLRDKFVTVYIAAEMQSPGGGIYSPVTRLYLSEENFGRTRIEGAVATSETKTAYYTFRFNARNGSGSMEKLYIWSDGCVAIKSPIDVLIAPITEQRTQPLITRVDVTGMKEL